MQPSRFVTSHDYTKPTTVYTRNVTAAATASTTITTSANYNDFDFENDYDDNNGDGFYD
jgi:hypothetical protein